MEQSSIPPPSWAVSNSETAHLSSLTAMSLLAPTKKTSISSIWSTYETMAVKFDFYLRMNLSS